MIDRKRPAKPIGPILETYEAASEITRSIQTTVQRANFKDCIKTHAGPVERVQRITLLEAKKERGRRVIQQTLQAILHDTFRAG